MMKFEQIDDRARVWVVTRGNDGRLEGRVDPQFLSELGTAGSAEDVADIIAVAAGQMDVAATRIW